MNIDHCIIMYNYSVKYCINCRCGYGQFFPHALTFIIRLQLNNLYSWKSVAKLTKNILVNCIMVQY